MLGNLCGTTGISYLRRWQGWSLEERLEKGQKRWHYKGRRWKQSRTRSGSKGVCLHKRGSFSPVNNVYPKWANVVSYPLWMWFISPSKCSLACCPYMCICHWTQPICGTCYVFTFLQEPPISIGESRLKKWVTTAIVLYNMKEGTASCIKRLENRPCAKQVLDEAIKKLFTLSVYCQDGFVKHVFTLCHGREMFISDCSMWCVRACAFLWSTFNGAMLCEYHTLESSL